MATTEVVGVPVQDTRSAQLPGVAADTAAPSPSLTPAIPALPAQGAIAIPAATLLSHGALPVQRIPRPASAERTGEVMNHFQHVMQHFLETQRSVMLAYLTGSQSADARQEATSALARTPRMVEMPLGPARPLPPVPAAPSQFGAVPPVAAPSSATVPTPAVVPTPTAVLPVAPVTPAAPSSVPVLGTAVSAHVNGHISVAAASVATPPPPVAAASPPVVTPLPAPAASPAPALAEAAQSSAARSGSTAGELKDRLLAVVSDRTGYPAEMLQLEVDLEADLGIDSIKRVEIVGTFVRSLSLPDGVQVEMEHLTSSRTLQQVLDHVVPLLGPPEPVPSAAIATEESRRPFEFAAAGHGIHRFTVRPAAAPPIARSAGLAATGVIVIVDDGTGVGAHLESLLTLRGHRCARIPSPDARPEVIAQIIAQIRAQFGPAAALIHLAPLRSGADKIGLDLARWQSRLDTDFTAFFLLAQALRTDLEQSAEAGGAAVMAATCMGGAFASDAPADGFFPGHGSLAGFLKALAQEWTAVRVKAVDTSPASPEKVASWLADELFAGDGLVEVGYRHGQRTQLLNVPSPLDPGQGGASQSTAPLDSSSVVLVTGGARGITAEVALSLAEAYRPRLVLVGRTPLAETAETAETAALTEPVALKRAIIEQHRRKGLSPTPAGVEAVYRRVLSEREVRTNVARFQQAGASVDYRACDVRDACAVGALIDALYETYGRIDGLIHGAGIIEDKLVRDKTLDSLERVVSTKVDSAVILAQKLRPETLKCFVLFSSIAGWFGNRGQADYGAANEVLNKLAVWLEQRWPGRVLAVNWAPWATMGMASPEVQRQFLDRGVALVPPKVGNDLMLAELTACRRGESEVMYAGGSAVAEGPRSKSQQVEIDPRVQQSVPVDSTDFALPLLSTAKTLGQHDGRLELERVLDLATDRYLHDHRLEGRPVFPLAMAAELIAEAAAACLPHLAVTGLRQLKLYRGITLDGEGRSVRVVARARDAQTAARTKGGDKEHNAASNEDTLVDVVITATRDPLQVYYKGVVELGQDGLPSASALLPASGPGPIAGATTLPVSVAEAYRDWLFHGPCFQGIVSIDALGSNGASAVLRTSVPSQCLASESAAHWIIDPILVDCALQVQLIWARLHWNVTSLPNSVEVCRWFSHEDLSGNRNGPSGELAIRCEIRIRSNSNSPMSRADHYFYTPDGRLLGYLEDVEMTGSVAANRLVGHARAGGA